MYTSPSELRHLLDHPLLTLAVTVLLCVHRVECGRDHSHHSFNIFIPYLYESLTIISSVLFAPELAGLYIISSENCLPQELAGYFNIECVMSICSCITMYTLYS